MLCVGPRTMVSACFRGGSFVTQPNEPNPVSTLQFETAEYAGDQPPAEMKCGTCGQPIANQYYSVGTLIVCPQCRDEYLAHRHSGTRLSRFFSAIGLGLLAALAGSILWFAVRKFSGYEIGLIAIVVGFLVGKAVSKGSRGRGGWGYQLLAVFLTYSSIVVQYVPDVIEMLIKEHGQSAQVADDSPADRSSTTTATSAMSTTRSAGSTITEDDTIAAGEEPNLILALLALLLLTVIVLVIAFVAPVLAGFENVIGLLIISFALWEAWKLNRRTDVPIAGPFTIGSAPAGPLPPTLA